MIGRGHAFNTKSLWEAAGMTKRERFPHRKKDKREDALLISFFLPRPARGAD